MKLLICLLVIGFAGCATTPNPASGSIASLRRESHPIVGCWRATDSTLFVFRVDGSFVGRDSARRQIWGSWVALTKEKAGFQSLLYANAYAPQTARVRGDKMSYTMTPLFGAIDCVRITQAEAETELEKVFR